jgi:predicted RecA/RadA family phage recombinase
MLNELRQDRAGDARFYLCPTTVEAGDLVLIGTLPGVAVDDYNPNTGGTVFRLAGTFALTVIAASVVSPLTGSAVKQGDKIYGTGTLDATTNITTDLTLSKASGGTLVGSYDDTEGITSGQTDTSAAVKLKETP